MDGPGRQQPCGLCPGDRHGIVGIFLSFWSHLSVGKPVSDVSAEPVELKTAENPFKHTLLQVFFFFFALSMRTGPILFLSSICVCVTPGAHPYVISEMEKGVALAALSLCHISQKKKPSSVLKNKSPPPHLLETLL